MMILIRYHEIALKGRNRPFFVERLIQNLRRATADLGDAKVRVLGGRLSLELPEGTPWEALRERIASVFGVANFSRATGVPTDLDALKSAAVTALRDHPFASFRVTTKRSHKGFLKNSGEVDREVGAAVQQALGKKVDLEHPELTLFVEILRDQIFYSLEKIRGPGGFPVGSSGRVLALLSGGIDSPVAACRMMKRGCTVTLAHFHAFPLQDHTTIDKTRDLARLLTRFQFRTRLLLVPFGPVQQEIVASCPAPLRVVLYRRFMVRIAEALARRTRAKALVTGESLGQVASQTLDNMSVIDEAAHGVILRPLVGMDKEEITEEARRIGTYAVSTLPDQDCCQLFVGKSPSTAATLEEVRRAEEALGVSELVGTAARAAEEERYVFPENAGKDEHWLAHRAAEPVL
jgi:thiamine biosynthesis protein ThiI